MRALFVILLGLVMSGCHTMSRPDCRSRDWYAVGRQDGARGTTNDSSRTYRHECGGAFDEQAQSLYRHGRDNGLVEFCQPRNAFELGRRGIAYSFVCPVTMEDQFLFAYRRGQLNPVR